MYENKIKMSFIDKTIRVQRNGNETMASIKSGFMFKKFDRFFEEIGFNCVPQVVVDILKKNGYRKDYKLNMWVTTTNGVSKCAPGDEYDDTIGARIALMRAKRNAYRAAEGVLYEALGSINKLVALLENTYFEQVKFLLDETDAIDRVIETGKSDR